MNKERVLAGAVLFAFFWSGIASAQDAVAVDPQHHKVEFENDQVRVLRITFPPGEKSVMHSHPCAVAIGLSDSTLTFHLPDGATREAKLKPGQVINAKPTVHDPENRGSSPAQVILVEIKSGGC
jgi:quercetin dioxygenase-like cupin family protein